MILRIVSILTARLVALALVIVAISVIAYPRMSRDLCVKDPLLLQATQKRQLEDIASLFSKSGLEMRLSCSSFSSIKIVVKKELGDPQAIGQTRMNGLIRTVYGHDQFLPMILPRWPLQEIQIKEDFVESSYFELIIIHEIGHVLGIGHSTDPHNVMYPELAPQINPAEAVEHIKELSYVEFK